MRTHSKRGQVEDGAATGNLEIVVSNEGAQLEGTVTDSEKNQPLAAAQNDGLSPEGTQILPKRD